MMQMLLEFSEAIGDNYEKRCIFDSNFDELSSAIISKMKAYSNDKLQLAADNLDWDNCYYGGTHCARERHEQSIESLKDVIE